MADAAHALGAGAVEHSRLLLREAIGMPADVALVGDAHGAADELAAAGARALLDGLTWRELPLAELPSARGELALLARGEGGVDHLPRALGVAALRFERVIVLPAPFAAHDDELLPALECTRAVVFARDPESLGAIASVCDARLAHDCAFFFDYSPYIAAGSGELQAFGTPAPGLDAWMRELAAHELIRTDAPRTLIAAALLGRRVEYSGADGRLDWLARQAFAGRPLSRTGGAAAPALRPAPAALSAAATRVLRELEAASHASPPARRGVDDRVTVLILTRDRPGYARRALDSLERAGAASRVIVIDQNSAPEHSRALAAECDARPAVELRRVERNLGCAGGRRFAAELAETELLLFLDDDAEMLPGALDHLVAALDTVPDAGAVTATVVTPDGLVTHSGGWRRLGAEIATFGLIGSGLPFAPGALPPTGRADWVPGGALLSRRRLHEEFPLDAAMAFYYEDNEWCQRVARVHPRAFLRSREALVLHHLTPKRPDGPSFAARSQAVELLAAQARFYERHGLLLGPWLFHLVPELTAADHTRDLAGARLVMELVNAKGTDWLLTAWMNGELRSLIGGHRSEVDLRATRVALAEARRELAATWHVLDGARRELEQREVEALALGDEIAVREEEIRWLHDRHGALLAIEQGGWWRLRERLLPLLRLTERLRR